MFGTFGERPLDYTIEGAGGRFRVRIRDVDGHEHVREFPTRAEARAYVQELRSDRSDPPRTS